jgi:murein DD-endopeptidase MepM/ murein hydrolase activator NlpD
VSPFGGGPGVRRGKSLVVGRVAAGAATAAVALLGGAGGASADPAPGATGGASLGGGASADVVPVVTRVACVTGCQGAYAKAGSTLVLRGRWLGDVASVAFVGAVKVPADDVTAKPVRTSPHRVRVKVPAGAATGPVVVRLDDGTASKASKARVRIPRVVTPKATGGPIATAVSTKKAFFDGEQEPTLSYALQTPAPANVSVSVVRADDGVAVATFAQGAVAPGATHTVAWDGTDATGSAAPEGRYAFVVTASDATGLRASTAAAGQVSADGFTLLGHRFPIRGKHTFGTGVAAFGGGRGHQGEDVFAACGTPLVAARGGVVKLRRFQARAGNYLVIDGEATDIDNVYMHLRDPALVRQGDRVRTGELIGYVGDTGDADGCHLHFEEWSGPGWYTGGSPFDPLPDLKAWDAVS